MTVGHVDAKVPPQFNKFIEVSLLFLFWILYCNVGKLFAKAIVLCQNNRVILSLGGKVKHESPLDNYIKKNE